MKAIIPVAGAGAKLRPHTYTQPKALIPIAGKTILSFIVDQLREVGIDEFIFVVGYLGDKRMPFKWDFAIKSLTKHKVAKVEKTEEGLFVELLS